MNKNQREKDILLQMADLAARHTGCFTVPERDADTYFVEKTDHDYLREYGFETVPELRNLLQTEMELDNKQDELLLKMMTIAAFKNRNETNNKGGTEEQRDIPERHDTLPSYIYNM